MYRGHAGRAFLRPRLGGDEHRLYPRSLGALQVLHPVVHKDARLRSQAHFSQGVLVHPAVRLKAAYLKAEGETVKVGKQAKLLHNRPDGGPSVGDDTQAVFPLQSLQRAFGVGENGIILPLLVDFVPGHLFQIPFGELQLRQSFRQQRVIVKKLPIFLFHCVQAVILIQIALGF